MDHKGLKELLSRGNQTVRGEEFRDFEETALPKIEGIRFNQCDVFGGLFSGVRFLHLGLRSTGFSETRFSGTHFDQLEASHYLFEKTQFRDVTFRDSDLSGGCWEGAVFSQVSFFDKEMALCEIRETVFEKVFFENCLFNGSYFEKVEFRDCEFKNCRFDAVEGLSEEQIQFLREKGCQVRIPLELSVEKLILGMGRKIPSWVYVLMFFMFGFWAGVNRVPLERFFSGLISLESNPLAGSLDSFSNAGRYSWFYYNPHLPNFDFGEGTGHWKITEHFADSSNKSKLSLSDELFVSFPSSLCLDSFDGILSYSRVKNPGEEEGNPEDQKSLWLGVFPDVRALQLSFYYRGGHPTFVLYGRFKEGGMKILARVDARKTEEDRWIYYSEQIQIPENISEVALRLQDFPQGKIYLDDVNLEKPV